MIRVCRNEFTWHVALVCLLLQSCTCLIAIYRSAPLPDVADHEASIRPRRIRQLKLGPQHGSIARPARFVTRDVSRDVSGSDLSAVLEVTERC